MIDGLGSLYDVGLGIRWEKYIRDSASYLFLPFRLEGTETRPQNCLNPKYFPQKSHFGSHELGFGFRPCPDETKTSSLRHSTCWTEISK